MTASDPRPIRALVFDLDGTLADTLRSIADGVNHALATVGLPTQPLAPFRMWVGDGLPMLCERATQGRLPERRDEVVALAAAHYRAHQLDHSTLYPGIAELLDALAERRVPMAVLSNKPHEFTAEMVAVLCGRWTFAAVEGCRDDALRKPHPQTALQLCDRLGTPPAETAFVGDTAIDMHTAANAGMIAVGVTWGFRDIDELRAAGATHLIDRPAELLALVASS